MQPLPLVPQLLLAHRHQLPGAGGRRDRRAERHVQRHDALGLDGAPRAAPARHEHRRRDRRRAVSREPGLRRGGLPAPRPTAAIVSGSTSSRGTAASAATPVEPLADETRRSALAMLGVRGPTPNRSRESDAGLARSSPPPSWSPASCGRWSSCRRRRWAGSRGKWGGCCRCRARWCSLRRPCWPPG